MNGFHDIFWPSYDERRELAADAVRGLARSLRPGDEFSLKAHGRDEHDGRIFTVVVKARGLS